MLTKPNQAALRTAALATILFGALGSAVAGTPGGVDFGSPAPAIAPAATLAKPTMPVGPAVSVAASPAPALAPAKPAKAKPVYVTKKPVPKPVATPAATAPAASTISPESLAYINALTAAIQGAK